MTILIEGPRSLDPEVWAAHAAELREWLTRETDESHRQSIREAIARAELWSVPIEPRPIAPEGSLHPDARRKAATPKNEP